jgi:hypothetical protein
MTVAWMTSLIRPTSRRDQRGLEELFGQAGGGGDVSRGGAVCVEQIMFECPDACGERFTAQEVDERGEGSVRLLDRGGD